MLQRPTSTLAMRGKHFTRHDNSLNSFPLTAAHSTGECPPTTLPLVTTAFPTDPTEPLEAILGSLAALARHSRSASSAPRLLATLRHGAPRLSYPNPNPNPNLP